MFTYLKALPRIVFKRGLPLQLIYYVTSRCNSNCTHCFLRGNLNRDNDVLRLDEIEKIAKGLPGLLSLSLTGGEPFLREDLPEIAAIFYKNTAFKNLVVISNGLLTDKIINAAGKILSDCRAANIFIGLSFDGLEGTHNSIRGVDDAFARTLKTLLGLKRLKSRHKNLSVGTCTTCSENNQNELLRLYDFLFSLGPDGIGINLMRGSSWQDHIENIDVNKYRDFAYKKLEDWKKKRLSHSNIWFNRILYAKEKIGYDLITQTYSQRRHLSSCYAGRLLAIMRETGDIYPCEMIAQPVGNIRDYGYDFKRLWSGPDARKMRKAIDKSRCYCTYECATTSNILFNPRYIPSLIKAVIKG